MVAGTIQAGFVDISNQHENFEAIEYVREKGIVQGYEDGSYQSDKKINRAEFTKIIIKATFSDAEINNCDSRLWGFPDVNRSEWFAPYVCMAKKQNIIQGYDDGNFKPGENINFVEAAKILVKTFGLPTQEYNKYWYTDYVMKLSEKRSIPLTITALDKKITRGEMAEFIHRLQVQTMQKNHRTFDPDVNTFHDHLIETTPTLSEEQTCAQGGGNWEMMPNGCGDTCEYRRNPQTMCTEALEEACNCGDNKCWNGESCELIEEEVTIGGRFDIPRTMREVNPTEHPGEKIDGSYISSYKQWTEAGYLPSANNITLDLETEWELREDLLKLLNKERTAKGLTPYTLDKTLTVSAQNFAEHLVVNAFYSHMDKWGNEPFDRAKNAGYIGWVAESMVWRKSSVQDAVDWWKRSNLHWTNIQNPKYTKAGIGLTKEPGGGYLVILMSGE